LRFWFASVRYLVRRSVFVAPIFDSLSLYCFARIAAHRFWLRRFGLSVHWPSPGSVASALVFLRSSSEPLGARVVPVGGASSVFLSLPPNPSIKRTASGSRLSQTLGGMKIERAAVTDAPRISALIRELSKPFLVSPSGEGAEPFFAAISEAAIHGYVSAGNFEYYVAEAQGQLAGVVALRDSSHLFHLFVAEPFQGQWLGSKLWQVVKARAIQSGNPGKFTVNSSLNALPVYEKFGFIASGPVVQTHGVVFQPMQLSLAQNAA